MVSFRNPNILASPVEAYDAKPNNHEDFLDAGWSLRLHFPSCRMDISQLFYA
jgi:hypothetical protein